MYKLFAWITKHKRKTIGILLSIVIIPILISHLLFKLPAQCYFLEHVFEAGDLLGYFGDVLSFVGTIVLGYIAVSQTEKANQMNDELLQIERNKIKPCLDVQSAQLYKMYLAEDMYDQFAKSDRTKRMVIELRYLSNPRSGVLKDIGLIELKIHNSGGSDIRRMYAKVMNFYLYVLEPCGNCEKYIIITGDTSLQIGEEKSLLIYIKREVSKEEELYDDWYETHLDRLMPHMEFDFTLETTSGELYNEKLICDSGWDSSMQSIGKTITREIGVQDISIEKIK